MDGLIAAGIGAVFLLALVISFAKASHSADTASERTGERLAMHLRDWEFPERQDV